MNDEDLKRLWQQQPLREPSPLTTQLASAMHSKTSLLRRCLEMRDLRELLACGVLAVVFGYYIYRERSPVTRVGWCIVLGSLMYIAWTLIRTRQKTPPAPAGATVVESLRAELAAVHAQSQLLGSVLWWYLLPLFIGLVVATWGMPIPFPAKIPAILFYFAIYAFLYWLNQWARSKQFDRLEAKLEAMLHAAETGEPLEEPVVADLRPIVVSMEAADRVKPVDFKVAFWQLGIFGEIGFVGMWFFWMLSLTLDNPARVTNDPVPLTFTRPMSVEESARYTAVARKVIDVLNAADYAGVQQMYDPAMGKLFPPDRTREFYTRLAEQFGEIEKLDGPSGYGHRGWIAFRLHCERGELWMSLALDGEDRISGIHFRPASTPAASAFRLFSWQSLAWLVPFFLAGLVYTWLIQKTTERAVGISSLGIHLLKGQNLILWDEIKEVRPMKFLFIRNLWVIKESGEKTLMHWTPLERHSELKDAVERFAPAVHPLREYLPLLRRT